MKSILLFGAGKSATVLIDYLLKNAEKEQWHLTLADAHPGMSQEKIGGSIFGTAVTIDISNEQERISLITQADIVISLLPPAYHIIVARDCITFSKNLLTASYIDESMRSLQENIEGKDLLFLCEMGLDPGIDHMSAKKMIDDIHEKNGKIDSFISHCGGLVAQESDNNPWHYKISWNPRNVVMAGKAGAIYKQAGDIIELNYEDLFAEKRYVAIPGNEALCWYPNRDSLGYISKYGLQEANTFIRTTLRHPDYIYGWKNIIDLKLTSEDIFYNTDNCSLSMFFREHMDKNGFSEWLENKLRDQFDLTKGLLAELVNLVELEQKAADKGVDTPDEIMMVDGKGDLQKVDIDDLKINAAATLADKMHDASLTLKQLFYLGMDDDTTMINRGKCSASEVLQFALEKKLALQPGDKDLVIMLHEIEYTLDNQKFKSTASLVVTGEDDANTAMAKTVGLPLGIAAKLIMNGIIREKGLLIPIYKSIYLPVLEELKEHGILFMEETIALD